MKFPWSEAPKLTDLHAFKFQTTKEVPNSWLLTYFNWAIINHHVTLGRGILVDQLTAWGTGLIPSSSFRPHPGRMRDLFRQLHAVRHGTETLVYSNHQREAVASWYQAKIFGWSASGVPLLLRPTTEPMQIPHECTLLDHLTAWGTGMIAIVVLFAPIRGGSLGICSICCMLYRSTSLQQSSKGSCSLLVSGQNFRVDCQWHTLLPPLKSWANADPAY